MLTKQQKLDQINDLEEYDCPSTLAAMARIQIAEIEQLKAEIDRLKAIVGILESANDELREIVKGGAK